jgi:uncharacterized membrane protein
MTLLILGLALWTLAHFWKRFLPAQHAGMGDRAKLVSTIAIVVSMVLMVIGYKMVNAPDWSAPHPMMKHLSMLLIVIGFYFMTPGPKKGALFHKMRHPMLTGFSLWAAAHVVLNPDLGSYVLFVGLIVWAIGEIIVINHQDGPWEPHPKGTIAKDAMFFAIAVVSVIVIGLIHGLVGPSPFGM